MGRRSWYCVGHFSPPSGSSQVFKMGYVCRSLRTCTSVHVLRVLQYEVVCAWAWLGFTEPGSLVAAALCWTCRCPPSLPPIGCTCLRFSNAVHPSFSRTVLLHPSQSLTPLPHLFVDFCYTHGHRPEQAIRIYSSRRVLLFQLAVLL